MKKKSLIENKLAQIILRIHLSHLINESAISIDCCFDMVSESLTIPNPMGVLIDLSLKYDSYVVVQHIQV